MPPQLHALTEGPNLVLDKPILLLGRHQECDIQLASGKVSRRHCCIAQVNDHLVVRDLGSTNGIRINGVRVLEGKLKSGDELTIGNFRYRVDWEPRPAAPPSRPEADFHSARPAGFDADLESCDEPVALPEPDLRIPTHVEARPAPVLPPQPPIDDVSQPGPTESDPPSLVLPDKIELAPLSRDALRGGKDRPVPPV